MSRHVGARLLTVMAITAMAVPMWAKSASPRAVSATVYFDSTAKVGSRTLSAGTYKVIAEGSQAKFERDGKIVAEVPCTWKTLPNKAATDEFVMDHNQLTEIQVQGKTQAVEFLNKSNSNTRKTS
jgi:hypothetical protein